jgi:hypothetical protein
VDESQWWERGQDGWHYKDDWRGKFVQGGPFEKTITIDKPIRQAFMYVFGNTLTVNGKKIGSDIDGGTIEDYDITDALQVGENKITVDAGRETAFEGAVILEDGSEILFESDESWGGRIAGEGGRRQSERNSYGGDTHMARVLAITTEQKAKGMVNTVNMTRRRMENYDCYMFWKNRDPREVLTLDVQTPERKDWARIWELLDKAKAGVEKPTALIKEGKFAEAIEEAKASVELVAQAEGVLVNLNKRLAESNRVRAESLGRLTAAGNNVELNGSKYNRLGWVASTEPLDNDPLYWEFDIAPAEAGSIGLAGYWKFNLDIAAKGEEEGWAAVDFADSGWDMVFAPSKWGWERQGYVKSNGKDGQGHNEVYNGHAWYRKSIVVPAAWDGKDLILNRTSRRDWYAQINNDMYTVFVNGQRIGGEDAASAVDGNVTIPANMIKFGQANMIAVHVLNPSNYGGIMNGGLRLSAADRVPVNRRSVCGPASVRQQIFKTPEGDAEQIVYSSSLSPGVVVATAAKSIKLGGWAAKGYASPTKVTCVKDGNVVTMSLAEIASVEPGSLGENWLLLWSDAEAAKMGRPTLVVFEKRPAGIELADDGFGGKGLTVGFEKAGGRIGIVRPFDEALKSEPSAEQAERCRLWSKAMLQYPTGYLEEVHFDGDICNVKMEYEHLMLRDDLKTEGVKLAPLPMLFGYAVEYKWPDAKISGEAVDLGNRSVGGFYPQSDTGTYKALKDASTLEYRFNRKEPKVVYKGLGIWNEWVMRDKLFSNVKKWGFNSTRPQLPLPAANQWDDPRETERLQTMIDQSVKYDLMCFVNWFTGQGIHDPNARKAAVDMWRAIAERYKDLPEQVVIYDFINEPADFRTDDFDNFMKQITDAVREVDKVHWISIEPGNGWAQPEDFDMMTHSGDEKTIYQYHFYGPHLGDCHRNDLWFPRYNLDEDRFRSYEAIEEQLLSPLRWSIRNNQTELFHGETGTSFLGPDNATELWLRAVLDLHEKYRAHWNWWTYDGDSINRTGLMSGDRENPLLSVLREYAAKGTPK